MSEKPLTTEEILDICRKHSFTAATFGYNTMVVPEEEWLHLAEQLTGAVPAPAEPPKDEEDLYYLTNHWG